jgi:hypothetical protein
MTCIPISGGWVCTGEDESMEELLGIFEPFIGHSDYRRTHPIPVMDGFWRYDEPAIWVSGWFNNKEDAELFRTALRARKLAAQAIFNE